MLLDRGCPLDVSDSAGDTVLHLANRADNNDLIAVLLRKGANPDILNKVRQYYKIDPKKQEVTYDLLQLPRQRNHTVHVVSLKTRSAAREPEFMSFFF